jgi:hypothetical protein
VPLANLITAVPIGAPPFTGFQVTDTGVYRWISSVQYLGTSGNGLLCIWAAINGNPIADSATITSHKNGDTGVVTVEIIIGMNAGDVFEWYAIERTGGAGVDIMVYGASGPVPLAPGIITTAFRLR